MSVPKSVVKFDKNGVKYTSNVDYYKYTIAELTRAAMRDVGKLICRYTNSKLMSWHKVLQKSKISRGKNSPFQYWVRKKECDLQVGVEHEGHNPEWYGVRQELGTSGTPKKGFLTETTRENIAQIVEIESKYLTALRDDAAALALCSEEEYEGGDE